MNKTLIALLAIFLVAMSACAVSAQEITDVISEGEGPGDDPTFLDAPNTADGTADNKDTADDATGDDTAGDDEGGEDIAVDMPLTDGGNEDIASNEDDSGSQSTNDLDDNATGNPILVLMASLALIGAYTIRRK